MKLSFFHVFGVGMLLFCAYKNSHAQATTYSVPSPTASSLAKFAEVPVGHYTGTPGISIPLYEIKTRDLSMAISLSYHAGGIRVEENASWVGLGWALNAGGVITRTIRGIDDFPIKADLTPETTGKTGFFKTPANLLTTTLTPQGGKPLPNQSDFYYYNYLGSVVGSESNEAAQIAHRSIDGEPDVFQFNVGGRAGKFIIDRAEAGKPYTIRLLSAETLRITLIDDDYTGIKGFRISTPEGVDYYFEQKEYQRIHAAKANKLISGKLKPYFQNTLPSSNQYDNSTDYTHDLSAGPAVTPEYNISSWYLTRIVSHTGDVITLDYNANSGWTHRIGSRTQSLPGCSGGMTSENYNWIYSWTIMRSDYREVRLTRINFRNGYVDFGSNSRDDQLNGDSRRLVTISVKEPTGGEIFTYNLIQSYFDSGSGRPGYISKRLRLDAIQKQTNGTECEPPYQFTYNSAVLPDKDSYAQDHWGFYNGQNANRTMIPNLALITASNSPWTDWNTNPNLGIDHTYAYPYASNSIVGLVNGANRDANETAAKAATLEKIKYPTGGETSFFYELHQASNIYNTVPNINVSTGTAGSMAVGGLRVSKISDNDNNGKNRIRNYTYVTPRLMYGITYFYQPVARSLSSCAKTLSSSSMFPVGSSAQGSHVGYGRVIEYDGEGAEAYGRTEFDFANVPEENKSTFWFQPSLTNNNSIFWVDPNYGSLGTGGAVPIVAFFTIPGTPNVARADNGSLLTKTVYSQSPAILQRTQYNYSQLKVKEIDAFKSEEEIVESSSNGYFSVIKYKIYALWQRPNSVTESTFDPADATKELKQITEYKYDSPYNNYATIYQPDLSTQASTIQTWDSKNQLVETLNEYAYDFSGSPFITMRQRFMYGALIRKTVKVATAVMSTTTTDYKSINLSQANGYGTSTFVPNIIRNQQRSGPAIETMKFDEYDLLGRVTKLTERNGLISRMVWYDDTGKKDMLREKYYENKPAASHSTYDYLPLVGVLNVKDANNRTVTYEYDPLKRLKNIKNPNGDIVKSYQYNYAIKGCLSQ